MPSILILEDDITFSLMLKTWLGRKGFEVSSVSSVSDARSRIEDASFDLTCLICVCRTGWESIC